MRRLDGNPANCKFKDLTGMKFGKLTVLHTLPKVIGEHRNWVCQCECGKQTTMFGYNLTNGHSHSCGCARVETSRTNIKIAHIRAVKPGSAFRSLLAQYKYHAESRGLSWELSDEQFKDLTSSPCYYTGALPASIKTAQSGEVYMYNGVDRLYSDRPYTTENCVSCCGAINMMKKDMPKEKFIELCAKVAERFSKCQVQQSI